MIRLTYKKNYISGKNNGTVKIEFQDLERAETALHLKRILREVSDSSPGIDPETGDLCFVSEIRQEFIA